MKTNGTPKVLFYGFRKTPYPILGIGFMVSNLRKHKINWDFQYMESLDHIESAAKEICKIRPEIVGLSATSVNFADVKKLSSLLKSAYNPIILLGGAHITSVPQTFPENIDVGFLGESEEIAVDIFTLIKENNLKKEHLKKIDGVVFLDENGQVQINKRRHFPKKLDMFPRPDRSIYSKEYWKTDVTSLLTSRGCP